MMRPRSASVMAGPTIAATRMTGVPTSPTQRPAAGAAATGRNESTTHPAGTAATAADGAEAAPGGVSVRMQATSASASTALRGQAETSFAFVTRPTCARRVV
jgi:hypothetical protein